MRIAIPTLNRADSFKTFDLACAIVGEENVYVFFHTEQDRLAYKHYNISNIIVTNKPRGIAGQRNAILDYFGEGEIVMMDDDIDEIYEFMDKKNLKTLSPQEIKGSFGKAFDIAAKNRTSLWGIYPVKNPFFMDNKINNKGLLIGWIMGIKVTDIRFDEQLSGKEDFDFGLQHIKRDRKFIRLNYLTCNAGINNPGGLDFYYNSPQHKEACTRLLHKWKGYIAPHSSKENEVRLII